MEKIKEEVPEKLRIAVLLSFISGYINAFTYNNAGELFAGAQTGNVIFMALHFAKGNFEKAVEFLIPIISFMIGQIFIYCFRNFFQRRGHKGYIHSSLLMLFIMIMLIVLLPFFDYHFIVVTLAFFAAIQSDTFQRLRGFSYATQRLRGFSYATIMMTGNVKNAPRLLIEGLVQRDRELLVRGFLLFLIIFSFMLGVGISTYFTQFVKKSALVPLILPLSYINYVLFKEEHNVIDVVKSKIRKIK